MIGDVLSDAVEEIRRYEKTYPHVYGTIATEIAVVVAVMDALRTFLDSEPPFDLSPLANARDGLLAALGNLGVVEVVRAVEILEATARGHRHV